MRQIRLKIASFCIILSLLCAFSVSHAGAAETETVRVLLSVGSNRTLSVAVVGEYECAGQCFFGGTLTVKALKNGVRVSHSKLGALVSGESAEVLPVSGSSRLRIQNARYGEIGYEGSMIFSKTPNGFVRAVNLVTMEQYQYGVLLGELGDCRAPEALKAQAVASRGFALSRLSPGEPFDLGDTNSYQVYKGCVEEKAALREAVDAVRGETLMRGGVPVKCYYCTANGGRTLTPALVWGSADTGVYASRFDPYDLEGAQNAVTLTVTGDPAALPEGVAAYLIALARTVCPEAEQLVSTESLTELADGWARLVCLVRTPSGEARAEADFELAALAAPEVLNAPEANVFFIEPTAEGPLIVLSRAEGHRIGMSHRGILAMAESGLSYREMLSFYYPGASLETRPAPAGDAPGTEAEATAPPDAHGAPSNKVPEPGDLDGDGRLTADDALYLVKYLLGLNPLTAAQYRAADFDGDGAVTLSDAKALYQQIDPAELPEAMRAVLG